MRSIVYVSLFVARWFAAIGAFRFIYVLSSVSLMTTMAISVDRLLALLLGLGYKQIVNLKRVYIALALFWVVPIVDTLYFVFVSPIPPCLGRVMIPSCLLISVN